MGVIIATETALSVAANATTSDRVGGTYQFIPFDGIVSLYARCSATGMNITLSVNGTALVNDKALPWTGTAGNLARESHGVSSFPVDAGSRVELFLRNSTGGALTNDVLLEAEPLE